MAQTAKQRYQQRLEEKRQEQQLLERHIKELEASLRLYEVTLHAIEADAFGDEGVTEDELLEAVQAERDVEVEAVRREIQDAVEVGELERAAGKLWVTREVWQRLSR